MLLSYQWKPLLQSNVNSPDELGHLFQHPVFDSHPLLDILVQ